MTQVIAVDDQFGTYRGSHSGAPCRLRHRSIRSGVCYVWSPLSNGSCLTAGWCGHLMTMMTYEGPVSAWSDNDQPDEVVINTCPARTVLGGLLPGLMALAWPSWSYYLSPSICRSRWPPRRSSWGVGLTIIGLMHQTTAASVCARGVTHADTCPAHQLRRRMIRVIMRNRQHIVSGISKPLTGTVRPGKATRKSSRRAWSQYSLPWRRVASLALPYQ